MLSLFAETTSTKAAGCVAHTLSFPGVFYWKLKKNHPLWDTSVILRKAFVDFARIGSVGSRGVIEGDQQLLPAWDHC